MGPFSPYDLFEDCRQSMTEGTCEWVLSRPEYASWHSPNFAGLQPKVLWIHGLPGAGKTMLCSRLVEHVYSTLEPPSAHFFFSSRFESCNNPFVAIRSWIAQIISVDDYALDIVRDKYKTQEYQDKDHSQASKAIVNSLLKEISHAVPGCTFIMDGLDECTGLIPEFLLTVEESIANSSARLLIVSRDEPRIRSAMARMGTQDFAFAEYKISLEDIREDAERVSRQIVHTKLSNKSETVRNDISKALAERAEGQFLWVKLQAEGLRRGMNKKQLDKAIASTPTAIYDIYQRNWDRIQTLPTADKKRAISLLSWTAFAIRPLTVSEITEAVLLDLKQDNDLPFDVAELPDVIDQDYIESEITALCPFIEVHLEGTDPSSATLGSATVHLAHYTVKEFMLSQMVTTVNDVPHVLSEIIEHSTLAKLCLYYIKFPAVWEKNQTSESESPFAFFEYAADYWYQHYYASMDRYQDAETRLMVESMFDRTNPIWESWTRRKDLQDGRPLAFLQKEKESYNGSPGPLYYAASLDLTSVLTLLLSDGRANVNETSGKSRTPLGVACSRGNRDAAWELMKAGADLNSVDSEGLSPIHMATVEDNLNMVKLLLDNELNLRANDESMKAALMSACELDRLDIARLLVLHGANVNDTDEYGSRPLHRAVRRGRQAITELLVEKGADVNLPEPNEIRPLHIACYLGNEPVVRLLLERSVGINIDQTMIEDVRPLQIASHRGNEGVMRLLIGHGADPDAHDSSGSTSLHVATTAGHQEVVKLLLHANVWIGKPDFEGTTALHLAVRRGKLDIIKLLLFGNRADISAANAEGWTALHFATDLGNLDVMRLLIEAGLSPSIADVKGWTPLHIAARYVSTDAVSILIDAGADISATTNGGWSTLALATTASNSHVMRLLIDLGADVEAIVPNPQSVLYKSTPLHVAASDGKAGIVELLVKAGAKVERRDKDGCTALFLAVRDGHEKVSKFLIEHGADIKATNSAGLSLIQVATQGGNPNIMKMVAARADLVSKGVATDTATSSAAVATSLSKDTEDSTQITISSQSHKCDMAFEILNRALPTSAYRNLENAVEDEAGRFQVWAGNIGAFQSPRSSSSLDSRLKNSELMRSNVQSGLERLGNAIERGMFVLIKLSRLEHVD